MTYSMLALINEARVYVSILSSACLYSAVYVHHMQWNIRLCSMDIGLNSMVAVAIRYTCVLCTFTAGH